MEPALLPEDPEDIVKVAVEKAKVQPVLFYGKSTVYKACPSWPDEKGLVSVADKLRVNAQTFFDELQEATSGFYFLEADEEKDLGLMRGVDYRNGKPKGICLVLACTFATKSEYLQALGRVRRSTDQGCVYELQQQMWEQNN